MIDIIVLFGFTLAMFVCIFVTVLFFHRAWATTIEYIRENGFSLKDKWIYFVIWNFLILNMMAFVLTYILYQWIPYMLLAWKEFFVYLVR